MAVDLRMLGAAFPIGVLGAVGDDEHGAFVLAECARLGIDTAGVQTLAGAATSFTDAMVERDGGRRTFFHHIGANALFDASAADLGAARILHVGAPGLHPLMDRAAPGGGNGWSALLQRARAAGLHTNMELVSLAPDRTAEVARPCLPHLSSIVVNELEAGALTGIDAPAPAADGPVDWPAARGDGARPDRAGRVGARRRALPGRQRRRRPRTAGPGARARSGCRASRSAARPARATPSPRASSWACTKAGRSSECLRLAVASAAACVRSPNTSDGIRPAGQCLAEADRAGYRQPD